MGGDWYDVVTDPAGRTCLLIGDVVGHGVHAAGVMGQMRAALHALATSSSDPDRVVDGLDRFASALPGLEMATLAMAVLAPDRPEVVVARVGHPPPVVVRPDGRAELLWAAASPPVGVGEAARETATYPFLPGDTLVL